MKLAEIHTLYEKNCRSIPDMLRQSAESIDTEVAEGFSPTKAMIAVQIAENGKVRVYGWGDTNDLHAIAVLQRGLHQLLSNLAAQDEL